MQIFSQELLQQTENPTCQSQTSPAKPNFLTATGARASTISSSSSSIPASVSPTKSQTPPDKTYNM